MTLAEKHRPVDLDDVAGQDKAVRTLRRIVRSSGIGGRAVYLSGGSGTGKTTIARILAQQITSGLFGPTEVVGRQLTTARLREITNGFMYAHGQALIVNESHGMSRPVVEVFLDVLENLPGSALVVFTTTNEGRDLFDDAKADAGPFASRCLCLKLSSRGLAQVNGQPGPFALRAYEIATKEGLNADYVTLINDCKGNLRSAIGRIEAGAMLED
jgi:replication-associated recombination protein RarA